MIRWCKSQHVAPEQAASTGSLGITLCLPRLHPHLLRVGHKQQPLPGTGPCETNAHRSHILFPASTFPFVRCSGARQRSWRQMLTSELGADYQLWNTQRYVVMYNSPWKCTGKLLTSNTITCKDKMNFLKKSCKTAKSLSLLTFAITTQINNWYKWLFL